MGSLPKGLASSEASGGTATSPTNPLDAHAIGATTPNDAAATLKSIFFRRE